MAQAYHTQDTWFRCCLVFRILITLVEMLWTFWVFCRQLALDPGLKAGNICHILVFKMQHMCMHAHKHSVSLCGNYAVLIVTMGIQPFPMASLYGTFGCDSLAAQKLCKRCCFVLFSFSVSGIL